jgi:DNA mismatch endonuclease (patch repair protein)
MDVFPEEKRREIMSRVKNKNTRQELLVRSLLHRLGYRFRLHRTDLPGTPDLVLPKHCIALFVHGCFWHGHDCSRGKLPQTNRAFWQAKIQKNMVRDAKAYGALRRLGWQPMVVWTCETTSAVRLTELGHRLVREIKAQSCTSPNPSEQTTAREDPRF